MEPVRDPFVQYSELLNKAFEKIKKLVPKKYKELKDLCTEAQEKVKLEKDGPYDANKYFYILKLGLDTKITKLMESLLYIIQKLISYEFLDGNFEDNCIYPDDQKPSSNMNGRLPRKLIDAIVESICNCVTERDNQVQLQIIKALLTIVTTFNFKVHEKSLLEAFRACYQIHITSTNQINQNTAKASLTQMINIVFSKMEAYSGNFGIQLSKLQSQQSSKNSLVPNPQSKGVSRQQSVDESEIRNLSEKSLQVKTLSSGSQVSMTEPSQPQQTPQQFQEEEKDSVIMTEQAQSPLSSTQNVTINFSAYDQYIYQVVTNMVDDVCLFNARQDSIKDKYISQINDLENSADVEEKQQLEDMMRKELEQITLKSVPVKATAPNSKQGVQEEAPQKTKKQLQVDIKNEHGVTAGKFGWCIVCRGQANLYCKDTRHPVCSFECKQKHMNLLDQIQAPQNEGLPNFYNTEEARRHFTDALIVFKSICKLCLKDMPNGSGGSSSGGQNSMMNAFTMRSKILGLELILAVVERPGTTFLNSKEFISIIKDTLCDGLLKYCVSNEKTIFSLSLSIFYCLFLHFREHLKQEIVVFLEQIFLRILDSGNSIYHHKYLILNVFDKLSQNTKHLLEIFINYDCDFQQKDILERTIDSLSKIAQGKFQKSEHQSIITPQEEYSLRLYALQIIVQMLRNINKTIEAENAEFKIAQREMTQASSKRDQSMEHQNSDDEDHKEQQNESNVQHQTNQIDKIQRTRLVKNEMLKASIKFNLKPKNGIAYLIQKGFIAKEPIEEQIKDIVNFLKTTSTLDKTRIGEYLGEDIDLNKKVLYYYVDSFNFENVPYVESLKRMLSGFRLPGEGQKVDRIMEKFGEKYCLDNHDAFGSAECIYLLSYATMMLQTSIHNPQAQKSRMSLDDFLKMTKGLNSGKDLDRDFIVQIYETVEKEPFTLTEDEDAKLKLEGAQATSFKRKQELFMKETQGMVQRGITMIKQQNASAANQGASKQQFLLVNDTEPIRPMFENTWSANLAVFSVLLEESDDQRITELCIEGFMHAIKISGFYNMNTERDAFVSSLSKFTQIITSSSAPVREIKEKNLECIRALLNLATYEGNYLRTSWYYVLDCISKIDYMQVLGTGSKKDSDFFQQNKRPAKQPLNMQRKLEREQALLQNSELIVQHIDFNKIDLIIQRSVHLDPDAIIDFITNLCRVSREELEDMENPRKFSLQRLVEVADFNMGRIRFVWQKIWQALSEHFNTVGSHPNLNVALYAIDSLRQLADKFLLKEEFGHYHFQKDFLKPFETIMLHNLHTRLEVKEFIIMAVANMCMQKAKNLKSGWSIVINIFTLAAQDTEEHLVIQSFETLKRAVRQNFGMLEDYFVELINCLNKYTKNNYLKQSSEALDLIDECAKNLSSRKDLVNNFIKLNGLAFYQRDRESMQRLPQHYGIQKLGNTGKSPSSSTKEERKASSRGVAGENEHAPEEQRIRHSVLKGLWFPIMNNLTNLIMDRRKEIQEKSSVLFFKILNSFNSEFTLEFWREILNQIVLPLLEDIHLAVEIPNKNCDNEFYKQIIQDILEKLNTFMVNVASKDSQLRLLIPDFIDTLALFISNINEVNITNINNVQKHIAQVVINQFKSFISQIGKQLSANQWNSYIDSLSQLFEATIPQSLIDEKERYLESELMKKQAKAEGEKNLEVSPEKNELPFNQDACFTKCIVQLLLISAASETVEKFYELLSLHNLFKLLECLDKSYRFAKEFNQELGLRLKLWNDGFMADLKQLPGLTAQERESISTYLKILFRMYFQPKDGLNIESNSKKLFDLCSKVLKDYCLQQSELISLMNSKREENSHSSLKGDSGALEKHDDEQHQLDNDDVNLGGIAVPNILQGADSKELLSNLHENELERQLQNMTPIVSNIILANLLKLSEDDLRKHVKEVGPLLIDLSLCNNYEIRHANKELLSRIFEFLVAKLH